jgi:hypothetical protein
MCLLGIFLHAVGAASIDIVEGDEWSFFIGKKEPPSKWNHIGFDKQDKDWIKGRTGIGYSHQRVRTQLNDMRNNYRSVYAKRDITFSNAAYKILQQDSTKVTLSVICDGSFKVWLNGVELIRSQNERGIPREDVQQALEIDITDFAKELLLPGENVLAAECSNDVMGSGSFLFIPTLRVMGR